MSDPATMEHGSSRAEFHDLYPPYKRFHIETKTAPHRKQIPNPFYPRVRKVGLVKIVLNDFLRYGVKGFRKEYRNAVLSRPCIYGVFDSKVGGLMPRRQYCTGCMRCVLEYPNVCSVDRNPEFARFGDSYWVPDDPSLAFSSPMWVVNYEASTGKIPIKGMGFKGAFAGDEWDSMWTDMSEIVRPTRDGVHGREYISTLVDLGRKPSVVSPGESSEYRVASIPVPILFDFLPGSLANDSVQESIRLAAERIPTIFVDVAGLIAELPKSQLRSFAPLIDEGFGDMEWERLARVAMIEVSEGMFDRVSEDIRESAPGVPVFLRLNLRRGCKDKVAELERVVDGFHLIADFHGREFEVDSPRFVKDALHEIHIGLVELGARNETTLIVGGGIILAEHVPKAIIMGADAVSIDTSLLVALQAEFRGDVRSRRSKNVKHESFSPEWGAQRVVNLVASWHAQLIEVLSAMGMRDVRRLRGDVGRAMFNEDLEKEAFADIDRA